MALDEYQNLNSNTSYFITSLFTCVAPHPLIAAIFTYEHEVCRPTNFVLNQPMAESMSALSGVIAFIPILLILMTPTNWNWVCCGRCKPNRVSNFDLSANDSTVLKEKPVLTVTEKLSMMMVYFNYLVCALGSVFFLLCIITIHVPQYMFKENGWIQTAFFNEIGSFLAVLILFACFKQREVTEQEIQLKMLEFKRALERKIQSQFMNFNLNK